MNTNNETKQTFFIYKPDGTKIQLSEKEWQEYLDKNCECGGSHHNPETPV